ncbi:MAG: hypothetical protein FJ030_09140 [Chloroflexi bacterium]|nr:hypothetical protein [Chloroflexota bacterium]
MWANKDMALSIDETADFVTVRLYTTSAQTLAVTLFVNGQLSAQGDAVTASPAPWAATWSRPAPGPLGLTIADRLGNTITRWGQTP